MSLKLGSITRITLGVQGETGTDPIRIDVSEWLSRYPDGVITVWNFRHGTDTAYPVAVEFDLETGDLLWTPTSADTQYDGAGLCQFRLIQEGVVKKSVNIPTKVFPALPGTMDPDTPEAYQAWVDQVEGYKQATVLAAEAAENAQAAAESYADDAEGSATQAASSATSAALFASQSSTSANAAQGFANSASLKATEASTSAAAADSAKTAAENAKEAAEDAAESIQSLTAAAETLDPDSQASASYDPETGTLTIGVPTGHQGDDGVSPAVTISTVTGGHTVKITDKDHPSGQSFTVLDGEDAFSITFTVTISATGITATSDKTWAQIVAAVVANQRLIAYVSANGLVAPNLEYQIINAPQQQGVVFYFDNSSEFVQGIYVNPAGRGMAITVTATGVTARYVSMEYIAAKVKMESGASVEEAISQLNQAILDLDTVKADKTALKEANRRIHLLEEAAVGKLYTDETVSETSYQQDVPSGSLSNAVLGMLGGKSVVWNQLDMYDKIGQGNLPATFDNVSKKVTVTASPSDSTRYSHVGAFVAIIGHKYLLMTPNYKNDTGIRAYLFASQYAIPTDYTCKIFESSSTDGVIRFVVSASADATITVNVFVFDLTQMFGSGSEPTSVDDPRIAEIEAYALAHPEYNSGEIVSADTNAFEAAGKNLLNESLAVKSGYNIKTGFYFAETGTLTVSCVNKANYGDGSKGFALGDEGTAITSYAGFKTNGFSIAITVTDEMIGHQLYFLGVNGETTVADFLNMKIQVEKGSSATAYKPYNVTDHPIPASVLAQYPLRSAGDMYDTITYEPITVDNVTVPVWRHSQMTGKMRFETSSDFNECRLSSSNEIVFNRVPNNFKANARVKNVYFADLVVDGSYYRTISNNHTQSEIDDFKAYVDTNGFDCLYEVETPIVTDITDLMQNWNGVLEVEEGGTITFVQENGTIFAVPNTVNYLVKTTGGA